MFSLLRGGSIRLPEYANAYADRCLLYRHWNRAVPALELVELRASRRRSANQGLAIGRAAQSGTATRGRASTDAHFQFRRPNSERRDQIARHHLRKRYKHAQTSECAPGSKTTTAYKQEPPKPIKRTPGCSDVFARRHDEYPLSPGGGFAPSKANSQLAVYRIGEPFGF